jgi:hypothetical protein
VKPILQNVVVSWYGVITLETLNDKPIKSRRIKTHLDISIMYMLHIKFLTNEKKFNSKGLLKTKSNSDPSNVHNYHLINVWSKNIHIQLFKLGVSLIYPIGFDVH